VAAIAFALGTTWALLSPPLTPPDEADHLAYLQHLAETGNPPDLDPGPAPPYSGEERAAIEGLFLISQTGQREGRPPWLSRDERLWAQRQHRERPAPDDGGGQVAVAPYTPFYYAVAAPAYLAAHGQSIWSRLFLARLLSALLGALTAACVFLVVRELAPSAPWAAAAAGLLVAFHPMFASLSGAVNNDAAVNALAALLLYLLVRGVRRGLSAGAALGLGATLVALPLAKTSGWFLYPAAALGLAAMAWRRGDRRTFGLVAAGFAGAFALWAVAAGLVDRSLIPTRGGFSLVGGEHFDPAYSDSQYSPRRALEHPSAYLSYLWQVFLPKLPFMTDLRSGGLTLPGFEIFIRRGWAAFGLVAIVFPRWVYGLIAAVTGAVGLMALAAAWRERAWVRAHFVELAMLGLVVVTVVAGFEAAYFSETPGRPFLIEQGRYAFPALAALAALVVGAAFAFGRRAAPLVATALVVAVMGLQVASQLLVLTSAYA
jgi:4-amino-4-deoxy-L-arabinose transferase-like glycosyltransferase